MRRIHRIVLLVALVALVAPVLSACADFDLDKLDVFGLSDKKKLPGDRKPLFPEGVPGVSQGIPPEYIKGHQPPPETAATLPAEPAPAAGSDKKTAAVEPVGEPQPKAKPKRKPKPRAAAVQNPPAAAGQQQPMQQAPAPWPAQGQGTGNSSAAPWPGSPAPGTFSR